jgi:hypothetical protein
MIFLRFIAKKKNLREIDCSKAQRRFNANPWRALSILNYLQTVNKPPGALLEDYHSAKHTCSM